MNMKKSRKHANYNDSSTLLLVVSVEVNPKEPKICCNFFFMISKLTIA